MLEWKLKCSAILLQLSALLDYNTRSEKGSPHSAGRHLYWFLSNLMLLGISCQLYCPSLGEIWQTDLKKVQQRTARGGECLNSSAFVKIRLGECHWSHCSASVNFCRLRALVGGCWDKSCSSDLTACSAVMGCWGAKLMDDNMGLSNGINASWKYQQGWKLCKVYSTFFSSRAKGLRFVLYLIT